VKDGLNSGEECILLPIKLKGVQKRNLFIEIKNIFIINLNYKNIEIIYFLEYDTVIVSFSDSFNIMFIYLIDNIVKLILSYS
jgi:hypothetical protein